MARASVIAVFPSFTRHFEGYCLAPYRDVEGWPTVAAGNLASPISVWRSLPWVIDGRPATADEIDRDWTSLHSAPFGLKYAAGYFAPYTKVRLTVPGADKVVDDRLQLNDRELAARLSPGRWEELPARAQLALHSWAWADGPEGHAPHLWAAVEAGDWTTAANEVHLEDSHNPGLVPRNAANKALLLACLASDNDDDAGWSDGAVTTPATPAAPF